MLRLSLITAALLVLPASVTSSVAASDEKWQAPEGFTVIFNGKDLSGWHGQPHYDPNTLANAEEAERTALLEKWNSEANEHWSVENSELVNDGHGPYMTSDQEFGDIELLLEYRTVPKADSGIYLRGTPQVQIWDSTEEAKFGIGADKGSGGLWNSRAGQPGKDPMVLADKPFGEWNSFRIIQVGARTTVYLNGKLVVDHAIMENFWDKNRATPLRRTGSIQLQTHGGEIRWRNIAIREIGSEEANAMLAENGHSEFTPLFDGETLAGWAGAADNYEVVDGAIQCKENKGGVLYTPNEYADFVARLEFRLPPHGNNGLAIRYPGKGDPAYAGMCELQILDSEHAGYAKLDARQYHASAYGMAAATRGYLRETGEWNFQEVTVKGSTIRVELNGNLILDTDLSEITDYMADSPHPGKDLATGHFGFAGHGDAVAFRNVSIKKLEN